MTSFTASFAIFSVIGYGAYKLQRPVEKVAQAGAGLAFVVYPKVLATLPGAVFFSIIFFLMLICVGLSSQFNFVQTVYTAILDIFPSIRERRRKQFGVLFLLCILCFLLGLPFVCPGGAALLQLVDEYCATWAVLLIGIIETTTITWLYGFDSFSKDLRMMMKWLPERAVQIYAVCFWGVITPGVLSFIMIFIWVKYEPRQNQTEESIGWFLTWFVAIWIPLVAIAKLTMGTGSLKFRFFKAISPSPKWGPFLDKFRNVAKHLDRERFSRIATAPGKLAIFGMKSMKKTKKAVTSPHSPSPPQTDMITRRHSDIGLDSGNDVEDMGTPGRYEPSGIYSVSNNSQVVERVVDDSPTPEEMFKFSVNSRTVIINDDGIVTTSI